MNLKRLMAGNWTDASRLVSKAPGTLALGLVSLALVLSVSCSSDKNNNTSDATATMGAATTTASAATSTSGTPSTGDKTPTSSNKTPTPSSGASSGTAGGGSNAAAAVGNLNKISATVDAAKPATVQIISQSVEFGRINGSYNVPQGVGTGVIYDKDGHVLTNNHVVEGAQSLLVTLPDGRSFDGTIVGTDPRSDLAVIKISGDNLPVAKIGDSSTLNVGDWTIAIGNALDLPGGPTVTVGVVSALDRTVQEPGSSSPTPGQGGGSNGGNPFTGGNGSGGATSAGPTLFGMIQTDAAINPGNSGGPLLDLGGSVIGINTLVATEAEPGVAAQGIGFAIAINNAKTIADQLISKGSVQHAYLGVNYVPMTPAVAEQLGTKVTQGAAVVQVVPGSPADQAGIKSKDIITQVDGKDLKSESDLARMVDQHKPGDKITLTVARGTDTTKIDVTLGQAPAS